jgi:hypothetical protein
MKGEIGGEPKGLPQKIVLFGSNFRTDLDTKIKSPILKSPKITDF